MPPLADCYGTCSTRVAQHVEPTSPIQVDPWVKEFGCQTKICASITNPCNPLDHCHTSSLKHFSTAHEWNVPTRIPMVSAIPYRRIHCSVVDRSGVITRAGWNMLSNMSPRCYSLLVLSHNIYPTNTLLLQKEVSPCCGEKLAHHSIYLHLIVEPKQGGV